MSRSDLVRALALAAAPLVAAGCSTTQILPPVTSFAGANCTTAPNLAAAVSLTPERRRRTFTVTTPVDASTPCLRRGEGQTPYLVYALPAAAAGTVVEVGGLLEGARIFSPAVATLDAQGQPVRSFEADEYLYRGSLYSVQFVPRQDERFVLVTADPSLVGRRYDAIAISTNTTTIATPYAVTNWRTGVDQNLSRMFSYEGSVMAVVHNPQGLGN